MLLGLASTPSSTCNLAPSMILRWRTTSTSPRGELEIENLLSFSGWTTDLTPSIEEVGCSELHWFDEFGHEHWQADADVL